MHHHGAEKASAMRRFHERHGRGQEPGYFACGVLGPRLKAHTGVGCEGLK